MGSNDESLKKTRTRKRQVFDARELVTVIEACGKAGVRSLKLGDTLIEFGVEALPQAPVNYAPIPAPEPVDPELRREDYLNMLKITNPLAYEQEMQRGESEN